MGKVKIAFVLSEYGLPVPAKMGGAIETLMTMLLEQNEKEGRFEFVFISPDEKEEKIVYKHTVCYSCLQSVIENVELPIIGQKIQYKLRMYFPLIFIKGSSYYRKARKIAKKNNVDYVIAEGVLPEQFIIFLRTWKKEKIATHLHHYYSKSLLCDKIFGRTIATSKYIADKWNEKTPEGVKDTYILSNCIENEKFQISISPEQKLEVRKTIGFNTDDFVVLFCGRLVEEKGIKELVDAVLNIQDPKVKLLLIGSDSFAKGNRGQFAKEIEKLVIENNRKIVHLDYVENNQLYQYYQSADLQVVPSIVEEAAGLVALEGMISKIPLIITQSGGMVEYVNKKYTRVIPKDINLVASLRKNIIELRDNPEERQRMVEGAYEWAKQFSKQRYYADFCNIMTEWRKEVEKNSLW